MRPQQRESSSPPPVALSFISYWRGAAIALGDLASSMFYAGGIAQFFECFVLQLRRHPDIAFRRQRRPHHAPDLCLSVHHQILPVVCPPDYGRTDRILKLKMKVITLEEHYRSRHSLEFGNTYFARFSHVTGALAEKLADIGDNRIADMDKNGIDMQVLSHTVPSPEVLETAQAIPLCSKVNDELAEAIARHPKRLAGFAALPLADPAAAAKELDRAVIQLGLKGTMIHGATERPFLDDPSFYPVLDLAQARGVPIYLHPAPPPKAVMDTYFSNLEPGVALMLSTAGWGWHSETALHTLRLIASGVFDRFPNLQVIIGHMGEMLPFQLARIDQALSRVTPHLQKIPSAYFQSNIQITTSGLFTAPPLYLALQVLGADRILFSIDYPYSPNETGRNFLDNLCLSAGDLEKITHQNAERLLTL